MITNFIRNMVQMGGTSTFEKARLSATFKGDYDQPSEADIQAILLTLGNKDPETRPQIGFTKIVEKMEKSDSKVHWNYIVKNLIILDRCIEYNYFVQDIASMEVNYVKSYTETNAEFKRNNVDGFIQKYYSYIKTKATLYSKRNSSFNIPKEQKKIYFNQQSIEQIFEELVQSQKLHDVILDLGQSDRNGLLKFKVNQYVFMLLMTTLINLYSTQYISILALLGKMLNMDINNIKKLRDLYNQFLKNNEKLIAFINSHRNLKGYADVNIYEIGRVDPRIIMSIEEYIRIVEKPTSNISAEEVVLEQGWIDQVLKIDEGYDIRQSIHEFEQDNKQQLINRQSIIQQTLDAKLTDQPMEVKILQYAKLNKEKFNLLSQFDENTYWAYHNNFSIEYIAIDVQFKQQVSTSLNQRYDSLSPRSSKYQYDFQKEDLINLALFDSDNQVFLEFQNYYCFDIQYVDNQDELQANVEQFLIDTPKVTNLDNLDQINEVSQRLEHDDHHLNDYQSLHSEVQNLLHDSYKPQLDELEQKQYPSNIQVQNTINSKPVMGTNYQQLSQSEENHESNKLQVENQNVEQDESNDIDLDAFGSDHSQENFNQQNQVFGEQMDNENMPVSDIKQNDDISYNKDDSLIQGFINKPEHQITEQYVKNTQALKQESSQHGQSNHQIDENIIKIEDQQNQPEIDLDAFNNDDDEPQDVKPEIAPSDKNGHNNGDIDLNAFDSDSDNQDQSNIKNQMQQDEPQMEELQQDDIDLDAFGNHDDDNQHPTIGQNENIENQGDLKPVVDNQQFVQQPNIVNQEQNNELDLDAFGSDNEQQLPQAHDILDQNKEIDLNAFGSDHEEQLINDNQIVNQEPKEEIDFEAFQSQKDQQLRNLENKDQNQSNDVDFDAFDSDHEEQLVNDNNQELKKEINLDAFESQIEQQLPNSKQRNDIDLDAFSSDHEEQLINDNQLVNQELKKESDLEAFESQKDQQLPNLENNVNQDQINDIDLDAFGSDHEEQLADKQQLNNEEQNENENNQVDLDAFGSLHEQLEKSGEMRNHHQDLNIDAFGNDHEQNQSNHEIMNDDQINLDAFSDDSNHSAPHEHQSPVHEVQQDNQELDLDAFGSDHSIKEMQDNEHQIINPIQQDQNHKEQEQLDNKIDLDAFVSDNDQENDHFDHNNPPKVVKQFVNDNQDDNQLNLDDFGQDGDDRIDQINQFQENKVVDHEQEKIVSQSEIQPNDGQIDLDAFGSENDGTDQFDQASNHNNINEQQQDQQVQENEIYFVFHDDSNNNSVREIHNENILSEKDQIQPNSQNNQKKAAEDIDLDAFGDVDDDEQPVNQSENKHQQNGQVKVNIQQVDTVKQDDEIDLDQFGDFDDA